MDLKDVINKSLKQWKKSKTLTVNGLIIAAIITIAQVYNIDLDTQTVSLLYSSIIIPVINIILRFFTNKPLGEKKTLLE
jgi:uncharacterized membrane protein